MTSLHVENFTKYQVKITNIYTAIEELTKFLEDVNMLENIRQSNLEEEARQELIDEARATINKKVKKRYHKHIIEQKKKRDLSIETL